MLHVLPLFPPSLREIRLGGFGLLDIFRIVYFGLVFDFACQTCKNSYTYVLSFESLSSLSSYNQSFAKKGISERGQLMGPDQESGGTIQRYAFR